MSTATTSRVSWPTIIEQAVSIVNSYDTAVTLRQLFYRRVSIQLLPNTTSAYKTLSRQTAKARRNGDFPALIDPTRAIHRYSTFSGPIEARNWLVRTYRRDRTENQDVSIYLGVEKKGIVEQLTSWFGDLAIPILALGGYSSQTYVDEIIQDAEEQDRPAVLVYAGDFDASGEDIDRDFLERTGCFAEVVRIALTSEQVEAYELPQQPGKPSDPRAPRFVRRYGSLVQVELDALPPDILHADTFCPGRWLLFEVLLER